MGCRFHDPTTVLKQAARVQEQPKRAEPSLNMKPHWRVPSYRNKTSLQLRNTAGSSAFSIGKDKIMTTSLSIPASRPLPFSFFSRRLSVQDSCSDRASPRACRSPTTPTSVPGPAPTVPLQSLGAVVRWRLRIGPRGRCALRVAPPSMLPLDTPARASPVSPSEPRPLVWWPRLASDPSASDASGVGSLSCSRGNRSPIPNDQQRARQTVKSHLGWQVR